ncbi:hypothetical protein GB928_025005 [Shinella curvata]|uniref:Uncharacterized protein n=1 Tax=Shinella curvata TaxID=1817964 RepID=A0ABT8XM21_9HYPH|nr:hypothetical protein [Shinella curvata]MCJ8056702.1 hypothetical protein [Shinella curvata]MDO6124458.1 hypothetical protein [Shinella curvata]
MTMLNGTAADLAVSFTYGPDGSRVKKASMVVTTLYPDASVKRDPATDV